MADEDVSMMVELLRIVRRETAEGIESIREEQRRTREAIERLALDHEDAAQRITVLENAARRRIGKK